MLVKTRKCFKRIWNDPVLSKVIAGLISLAILFIYRKKAWLFKYISLQIKIGIRVWQFIAFIIICALSIYLLIKFTRNKKNRKHLLGNTVSEFEEFEEVVDDMIWRGWYSRSTGKVGKITTYCPKCDLELMPPKRVANDLGFVTGKEYICEKCNESLFYFNEGLDHESFVTREIEKRLRAKCKS